MTVALITLSSDRWLIPWFVAAAVLSSACSTPAQRIDRTAAAFGYDAGVVDSAEFSHRVYRNRYETGDGGTLHVYLEGDGTPWTDDHRLIAADPTPRSPLMLELMALDGKPALYLGRPCYFGYADTPACDPALWTDARYSQRVVDSMAEVVRERLSEEGAGQLVLFGHSGGGVLAALLAGRLPQTRILVTVAANLDVDAWADLHAYSRLRGSLNPAREPALDARVSQLHLVGAKDTNVPPELLRTFASRQPDPQVVVMPGFDHVCCWRQLWPAVLAWVDAAGSGDGSQRSSRFWNH
jgi:pimeloyl-ACP methyl ester carboxylesterase